jgi:hypothetical protein
MVGSVSPLVYAVTAAYTNHNPVICICGERAFAGVFVWYFVTGFFVTVEISYESLWLVNAIAMKSDIKVAAAIARIAHVQDGRIQLPTLCICFEAVCNPTSFIQIVAARDWTCILIGGEWTTYDSYPYYKTNIAGRADSPAAVLEPKP